MFTSFFFFNNIRSLSHLQSCVGTAKNINTEQKVPGCRGVPHFVLNKISTIWFYASMCLQSLLVQLITLFHLLCHCPRLLHAMHQCITGNIHWPFFHSASLILETKERRIFSATESAFPGLLRNAKERVREFSVGGPTWQLAHHALYNQLARQLQPRLAPPS